MTRWVVDTSPLIFLSKLDRLDILRNSADEIQAPPAVFAEVQQVKDSTAQSVEAAVSSWLKIQQLEDRRSLGVLLADLDAGEAEAIALAREIEAEWIVMDDLDGRRLARRLGLRVVGTLGLLLAARLRGEIPALRAEIERLREAGFRATDQLLEATLRAAGELG